ILDIVGDLALLGRPVCGHIVAIKPSHSANCELAKQICAQMRKPFEKARAFAPPPPAAAMPKPDSSAAAEPRGPAHAPAVLDVAEVMKILPQRYPFLMVDKVANIEGNRIVGIKNVTINEPFFQGHFPGHPIMPGVLQLEAMAQLAGILMYKQAENSGKIAYFMSAENVKWRKPVRPGDQLVIHVEMTKYRGKIGKAKGTCSVEGETVSEAEVTFVLADR
ncbi:MAG: 3-hydroxyacyl-ACP dehydratase FabZ, partial [Verrucomicrobiales bacterium]|nr:3-hydroxyacyl-ACP dehydratase FabZ [Verrucomicrobiales bacterium]